MIDYEQVVLLWEKQNRANVFSGKLLYLITSESAQIENIDINYSTTKELFENKYLSSYTGDLRDLFSTMNNRNLADFYNKCLASGQKITPWFIRESHRILLTASLDKHRYHDNGERAGEYKKCDYGVGKLDVGSVPEDVEADVEELCDLLDEKCHAPVINRAAVLHCMLENIHPFSDGNGRVGRWLLNYLLVSENHPPVVIFRADRDAYYKALEAFDVDFDPDPMRKFIMEQAVKTWVVLNG